MLVGVHLIMTSPDEGGIQCLDQSNFITVTRSALCQLIAFDATEAEQYGTSCTLCRALLKACVFGIKASSECTDLPVGA